MTSAVDDDVPAIIVSGVGKAYPVYDRPVKRLLQLLSNNRFGGAKERWVLRDISFKVSKGHTLAIIGENGSGKSTLLQIVAGILQPNTGAVTVRGRVAALLELGAGFSPEFTGRENIYLVASLYGLTEAQIDGRIASIEDFADIGDYIDQPVKNYSSGMFVRLAFSIISHVDADILIIDEALAVGDVFFTQKCMRFLRGFMKSGTVLFVSHDIASVRALADQAIWIKDGVIQEHGHPKKVGDAYLRSHYARSQVVDAVLQRLTIPKTQSSDTTDHQDFRQGDMRSSAFENEIRVFSFDSAAEGFGAGVIQISNVQFQDEYGAALVSTSGGERVHLVIEAQVNEEIESPIFGFFVRNRLGQNVFGDNSYFACLEEVHRYAPGTVIRGMFEFIMPFLPRGDYSICAAVATGSNESHVQQHWVNDAVVLKSVSANVHADVIGIPMISINISPVAHGDAVREAHN